MKKDFLIALLLGFGVGLGIAVSVLYAPKLLTLKPSLSFLTNKKEDAKAPTPIPTKSVSQILEIETPQNELLTAKKTIEIKGKTDPQARVVIATQTADIVLTSENNGSFKVNLDLLEGSNTISISAYKNGQLSGQKILEIYQTGERI